MTRKHSKFTRYRVSHLRYLQFRRALRDVGCSVFFLARIILNGLGKGCASAEGAASTIAHNQSKGGHLVPFNRACRSMPLIATPVLHRHQPTDQGERYQPRHQ